MLTVYTPESALLRPRALLADMVSDLWSSRELGWRLATRDLRAQYRESYLGYLWAFITPLATTMVWVFLNSSGVVTVADTGIPYPVYVFTGTMLWQVFVQALQSPIQETSAAKSMLSKLNFPREAILLAGIIKQLSAAGVKIVILIPAMILLGVVPDVRLAIFPLALLVLMLNGFALGLLMAPLGTLYNDIGRAIPLVGQFAMYVTPVVFAMPTEGSMAQVFKLNFVTPLILTARAWLTGMPSPMPTYFLLVAVCSLLLFMFAWLVYRITMPVLVERMS
jgi:lipopolysaccharide transport system permease protein